MGPQRGFEQRRDAPHVERGRRACRHAASALPEREEETMKALVVRELWMEGGREEIAIAHGNDRAVREPCEHGDAGPDARDLRRSDEDRVKGTPRQPLDIEVRFERVDLPAERIPLDGDIDQLRERMRMAGNVLREEDRSGAGAPYRHPVPRAFAQLRDDAVVLRELADRRALTAGDDERVDV